MEIPSVQFNMKYCQDSVQITVGNKTSDLQILKLHCVLVLKEPPTTLVIGADYEPNP